MKNIEFYGGWKFSIMKPDLTLTLTQTLVTKLNSLSDYNSTSTKAIFFGILIFLGELDFSNYKNSFAIHLLTST